jgi:cell division protein FtsN
MRDMERIKPKYNVTLDNKQIIMLILSSVVILALVFIIGFVLGKNAGIKQIQVASNETQNARSQNAVVFTQQTIQSAEQTSQQALPPSPSVSASEQPSGEVVTQTTAVTKHTELTFYKSLTEEGRHYEANRKQTKKVSVKKNEHKNKEIFSIQCGAFREKAQAQHLSADLKEKYKLMSWIEVVEEKGKRLYRVKIGHFETKQKAKDYELQHLVPKGLRNCIVSENKGS